MKIKLLNLLNKILKKFAFLGVFSFSTSTSAQTTYQCLPCPEGSTSPAGSTSIQQCVPVDSSKTFTTSNGTMTLSPGWYRVTLRSANGSATTCGTAQSASGVSSCECWGRTYSTKYREVVSGSAAGGSGASASYLIYVNASSTATYNYNSGAPTLVIENKIDKSKRTFSAAKGGNGVCPSSGTVSTVNSKYTSFECRTVSAKDSKFYPYACSTSSNAIYAPLERETINGTKGSTGSVSVSGAASYDKKESSAESISVGAKITRL